MADLTVRDAWRRAWRDTTHVFDVHERPKLLARLGVAAVALVVSWRLFGMAALMEGLGEVGPVLAAFAFVFAGWFLYNLWWAPARLANDALTAIAKRDADLSQREIAIEATRPILEVVEDGFNILVTNTGASTTVHGELHVVAASSWQVGQGWYGQALWGRERKQFSTIVRHGHDRIVLGGFSPDNGPPAAGSLFIQYFNESGQQQSAVYSHTFLLAPDQPKPYLRLRISIYADPSPATPIVRDLVVEPGGVFLLPEGMN
jgi:hypothetical protein